MTNSAPFVVQPRLLCRICARPVALETSVTDERGKAVHEECYVRQTIVRDTPSDPEYISDNEFSSIVAELQLQLHATGHC